MIKLKDILNEDVWEAKESSTNYIINNVIIPYMDDTGKKIMKEIQL